MRAEVEPAQQRELLQEHRSLAPGAAFQHRVAVVVVGNGVFDRRRPAREIVGGEQAAMAAAGHVQHIRATEEAVHRLGDEAAIPGVARRIDARLARWRRRPRGRGVRRCRPAPGERTGCPAPGPCRRAGTPRLELFHSASNSGRTPSMVALMRGTMWMPLRA